MRHPRLVQMGLALAAAATAACSVSSSSFTPQDEAAIRAINDSASAYIRAGAWEKWAALYADDAVLQPPNARPVVGRAAIEHFGRSMPPSESAEMFGVRIQGSGDLAYLTSEFSLKFKGMPADTSKQLVVLRRTSGGWKAVAVSFNSDRSLTTPAATSGGGKP